ncbi:Cupin-5 domain-containing protein [Mycena indigotica]|uniref:Cupin-5 domain-containing protein n=1 Tax=Mycena indigotica TaxID=2126181 RepID=A0A8H6S0G5_9AGAR|nr:Cupin-5 domain-containing protein [Mycena indigotica]KAF7289965.1 Cupin-5 domain-containing protein [Mycena indigotica]
MKSSDILLIVIAVLFPPVSTFFICGCGIDLVIGILLSILGYIPGLIHSLWLIFRKMEAEERFGQDAFVYIGYGNFEQAVQSSPPPGYGATANNQV